MLVHEFTYSLSEQRSLEITAFVKSQPSFSQEQLPGWHKHAHQRPCYHLFYKGGTMVAVATVLETKGRLARIQFGPLVVSQSIAADVLSRLSQHYQRLGFWSLYIQSNDTQPMLLNTTESKCTSAFDAYSWSTIWVDLSREDLFSSFSKHHQRMVKKAQKLGLEAKILQEEDLESFNSGYCAMYKHRGHILNVSQQLRMLKNRYKILTENGLGMLYGAYDGEVLIGGIMVAVQGSHWFYVQGFASIEYRHLPVNHYLFHELFILAQIQGFKVFDMGGYNRFAKEGDQVYSINQFKKGFSDNIVDYAPQVEIVFKPVKMFLLSLFRKLIA